MRGNHLSRETGCQPKYKSQDADMHAVLLKLIFFFLSFVQIKTPPNNACSRSSADTTIKSLSVFMSVSNSMTHGGTLLFHSAKSTSCSLAAETVTRVSVSTEIAIC